MAMGNGSSSGASSADRFNRALFDPTLRGAARRATMARSKAVAPVEVRACRHLRRTWGKRLCLAISSTVSAGSWPADHGGRSARPETPVPDLQLLHRADALQAQRPRSVRHRLSAVRQGGLWTDLGRGPAMRGSSPPL